MVLPGRQPVSALSVHDYGGIWDIRANRWDGDSVNPVVLYCSEKQFPLIVHADDMPPRMLVYGSMGAGKTRGVLAPWLNMRLIEFAGLHGEIGLTAPTYRRVDLLREAIVASCPPSWYRWRARDLIFNFHVGVRVRLVSTTQQSEAAGSPVQGHDWLAHGGDEIQDQLSADSDIEARGRRAPGGRYKRMNTATAKDSPQWRNWRDSLPDGLWGKAHLEGPSNPFVALRYWEDLKLTMSPRDYQRKVLALDVGPERMLYHAWDRSENLRALPQIGAMDVTRSELAAYGTNIDILVGYDPGKLFDVSILLKSYLLPGEKRPAWWVVGEVTTEQSTTEAHAIALMRVLREKWGCYRRDLRDRPLDGSPVALIRADPAGNTEETPDRTVYTTFRRHGFDIRPAAYAPVRSGSDRAPKHGLIGKEARIEVVNTLLCNALGVRRLFVALDDRGFPVAPRLVESIELSERDLAGKAEVKVKGTPDLSHWTAALGYAVWAPERPRMERQA